ncbi:hypothetical protein [Pseudofrankia asymbiotica]|uniref:HTH marR-type domain-containing protein n=1 Tax=Pseudofrankia asymbiotica TaxID=1834516 RepID=A0A1V2I8K7_9ACTN|nr:hypothetical protein [Pseudofrankia asymbiotica]ONH27107.1 hypothetical protein BL253_22655 [Pseudofrankia asymbiotica]
MGVLRSRAHAACNIGGRTLEHERGSAASLPIAANVLRVVGDGTARVRDLPAASGVSKEAIAMATRYLTRAGLTEQRPEGSIALTPDGRGALDDYHARTAQSLDQPLRAALDAVVSRRDALAEGLVPPEGCWRGERPYLARTRRLLVDPASELPWHPMVLHRGGWPDGF